MAKRVVIGILAFLLLGRSRTLSAQADPAELLIRQGVELRKKGRPDEALSSFQRAYDLAHSPRAAAQLGLCEMALADWVAAEGHLSEAAASSDPWIERNRTTLEASLGSVRRKLALVLVIGTPAGAVVAINGRIAGKLPHAVPMRVLPGAVTVLGKFDDLAPKRIEVQVSAGDSVSVRMDLDQTPATRPLELDASAHQLAPPVETRVLPQQDSTNASRTPSGRIALFAAVPLSIVALGIGAWSHVQRDSAASTFSDSNNGCDKVSGQVLGGAVCEDAADRFGASQSRMVIGYAAAGVLAVAGLTLWVLDRREPSGVAKSVSWSCIPGLGVIGGGCRGVF
jgi:hypothetical protein